MKGLFARLWPRPAPVIERAGPSDARALSELHGAAFHRGWSEQEFDRILIERNAFAHRARVKKQVVGFIVSRIGGDEAEILSVAVARSEQGRGIGQMLLTRHLRELAGLGVRSVFLEVEDKNAPARRLYDLAGFSEIGRRENYYRTAGNEAMPALIMRRDLA